ncbi:MAG: sugar phosphate isomerase/epimerase [Planctomycetes bacterium]|nr:sugar phosphate isomerase/epimerase [Planctomycetota bacterium]
MVSRRGFLGLGGATLAIGGRLLGAEGEEPKKIPIGLQLFSVRNECGKDFPGTVEAVAKMGYKGVDFAGYYGWDKKPGEFRKLLDDNGLKCCGCHTGLGTLQGDSLKRTVDLHKALGNKFLIVPGGIGGKTKEGWLDAAKKFNEIAEKLKPEGMFTGYHNHAHEFHKFSEDSPETPWDVFFGNTVPEVVMQLDIGNGMGGGCDPVATLKKFPGRARTIHAKGFRGIVGSETDKAPWPEIFALCETTGKTEWYIVEEDGAGKLPPLETVKRVMENLKKMGKV